MISLAFYLDQAFYFLFIPLICWWIYIHEAREVLVIILLTSLFIPYLLFSKAPFSNEVQGEITYVSKSGFIVGNVFYETNTENLKVGDEVFVEAREVPFEEMSFQGGFDTQHFLMGKGVQYMAKPSSCQLVKHHFHLSERASEQVEKSCSKEMVELYQYFLLGNKSDEISDLLNTAKNLAILHLFAISGMHFSLIQKGVIFVLGFFMSEKTAQKVSLVIMGGYAVILRGNVSAWRSYLMMILKKITPLSDFQCFGLVGCFFIWINPQIIFNLAFIYSMAIYFLVILSKGMKQSGLFIYMGTMLISSYFQFEIYPLGYLAGLFFGVVISCAFPLFLVDVLLGGLLSSFNLILYYGIEYIMQLLSQISPSIIVGRTPLVYIYIGYFSLVYALYRLNFYHQKKYFRYVFLSFLAIISYPYSKYYGQVVMMDVGQGDCFLIQLPFNQGNYLIDTGGLDYQDVAIKRLIPFLKSQGIHHLDMVFISHDDFDHSGGLDSLCNYFKVDEVVRDFDEITHQNITLKQLNHYPSQDENEKSLVIEVTLGNQTYLFTGDISKDVEKWLVENHPNMKVDVLKVSHHGSNTSSSQEFLAQIQCKVALISVGEHNKYHHPSKDVLQRLEAYGIEVYRTDENGAVHLYFTKHDTWIEKMKKR